MAGTTWVTARDTLESLKQYDVERGKNTGGNQALTTTTNATTTTSNATNTTTTTNAATTMGMVENHTTIGDNNTHLNHPQPKDVVVGQGLLPSYFGMRKAAPETGLHRKHLASRQTSVSMPVEQVLCQQRALELILQQQQDLQDAVKVAAVQQQELTIMADSMMLPTTMSTMSSTMSSTNSTSTMSCTGNDGSSDDMDNVLLDLFSSVEQLVMENKALKGQLLKSEHELKTLKEHKDELDAIADELRNRCNRLERKLNEVKTTNKG